MLIFGKVFLVLKAAARECLPSQKRLAPLMHLRSRADACRSAGSQGCVRAGLLRPLGSWGHEPRSLLQPHSEPGQVTALDFVSLWRLGLCSGGVSQLHSLTVAPNYASLPSDWGSSRGTWLGFPVVSFQGISATRSLHSSPG